MLTSSLSLGMRCITAGAPAIKLTTFVRYCLVAVVVAVAVLVATFCLYGFAQGYHVGNALKHMAALHKPVVVNPPLLDVPCSKVTWVADIVDVALDESSGLTASERHPGVLWTVNDSGGGPFVYALGLDGETRARFEVATDRELDWETLDAVTLAGQSYLVIGDVGDNFRWRDRVVLLFVAEPDALSVVSGAPLEVLHELEVIYPEGPRDVEAMAIDAAGERVLLTSKRHRPPEIFSVPLDALRAGERRAERTAVRIAELDLLPQTTVAEAELDSEIAKYRHMPTGMDIAGEQVLITTYKHAYLIPLQELHAEPLRVPLPTLGQREAITFATGSSQIAYVSRERSEGKGDADLFRIDLARDACLQTPVVVSPGD